MRSPDVDLLQPAGRLISLKLDLNLLLSEQNGRLDFFSPSEEKIMLHLCLRIYEAYPRTTTEKLETHAHRNESNRGNWNMPSDMLVTLSVIVEGSLWCLFKLRMNLG